MIVTCPACATRFLLDPAALGPSGRTVRCARCAETWHQDPPPDAEISARTAEAEAADERAAALPDEAPSFMTRPERLGGESQPAGLPALPRTGRRIGWVTLGWVGLVVVVLLLLGIGYVARDTILATWPQTARLYSSLGLVPEPIGAGLQVRGLNSARSVENGTPTLVLAGQIANTSDHVRPIPPLHGVLKDAENKVLTTWSFSVTRARLLPGETAPFTTSIANPAPEATAAFVEFGPAS